MERRDLRKLAYSAAAGPVMLLAAACGTKEATKPQVPAQHPESNIPTLVGGVKGDRKVPTETPQLPAVPNVENFEGDAQVTLEQIKELAEKLPDTALKVDLLEYLNLAQEYKQEDPTNQDIYRSLDVSFQILNLECTTDGHKSVAKLVDQYVAQENPQHHEAKKESLYRQGPCGSALAGTSGETVKANSKEPEKTATSTDDRIYINGYYLYTDIEKTIETMVYYVEDPDVSSFRDFLNQNDISEVRNIIGTIKNKWEQNPNDPSLINDSIMIADLIQGKDDDTIRCKTFMLFGATIGHSVDPKNYPEIEHNFRGRGCDW